MAISIKISDIKDLKKLLEKSYILKGPRKDSEQNLRAIEMFFRKGHQFYSEDLLINDGYQLAKPSTFTKGLTFAFKLEKGHPDKYVKSNYSLIKDDKEIALYLKYEDKQH